MKLSRYLLPITILITGLFLFSSCNNGPIDEANSICKQFDDCNNLLQITKISSEEVNEGFFVYNISIHIDENINIDTTKSINCELYKFDRDKKIWVKIGVDNEKHYYYLPNQNDKDVISIMPLFDGGEPELIMPLPTLYVPYISETQVLDIESQDYRLIEVDNSQRIQLNGEIFREIEYEFSISSTPDLHDRDNVLIVLHGNSIENEKVTDITYGAYKIIK